MSYQKLLARDRAGGVLTAQLLSSQTVGTFSFGTLLNLGSQTWVTGSKKAIITIEDEQILVSAITVSLGVATATIQTRGYNGTTAATHAISTAVSCTMNAAVFDSLQDQIATNENSILTGLIPQATVPTISSATVMTIAGDQTATFTPGRVIVYQVVSTWYRAVIRSSSYSPSTTTINVTGDALPSSGTVVTAGFEYGSSIYDKVDYQLIKEASAAPASNPPAGYSWLFPMAKAWFTKDSDGKVRYLCTLRATVASAAGVLALDWSVANLYDITLTENITTVTHTNGVEGETYQVRIKQHASAAKTVALAGKTRYSNDITTYTMSSDVGAYDILTFIFNATDDKYDLTQATKGFQTSPSASNANLDKQPYGDGSDGAITFDGSTAYAALSSLGGGVYTLTRNVYGTTILLSGTAIVDCANAEVYATISISRTGTAKFRNNGNAASSGTGAVAKAGITLPGQVAGGNGGGGSNNNSQGGAGNGGTAVTFGLVGIGAGGGAGGPGSGGGPGAGGGGGAAPATKRLPRTLELATWFFDYITGSLQLIQTSSGSGGGGGGWGSGTSGSTGGSGGGGGGPAGIVKVSAPTITDAGTGTMFEAIGGAGGNGTAASGSSAASGGGGGGGGNGGIILRIYHTRTGTATTAVTGGAAGTGGAGAAGGNAGVAGTAGTAGTVYDIVV